MKILIVSSQFPPVSTGGVAYVSYNLYRSFSKFGHDVNVLAFGSDRPFKDHSGVIRLGKTPKQFIYQSFFQAHNLKLQNYDVIFMQHSSGAGLIPQLKRSKHPNVVSIIHVSTYEEMKAIRPVRGISGAVIGRPTADEYMIKYIHSPFLFLFENFVYHNVYKLVGICKSTTDLTIQQYKVNPTRIRTILNGVDLERFFPANQSVQLSNPAKIRQGRKLILFVGILRRIRKGSYQLLDFFIHLNKLRNDIDLLVIGDGGHSKSIRKMVKKNDLQGSIHFISNVDNMELRHYYYQADLTIVPSIYEGLPLVILESLACGTPVAATNVSCHREVITDENGVLLDPYNCLSWVEPIQELLSKHFTRSCVRNTIKHLNCDDVANRYLDWATESH